MRQTIEVLHLKKSHGALQWPKVELSVGAVTELPLKEPQQSEGPGAAARGSNDHNMARQSNHDQSKTRSGGDDHCKARGGSNNDCGGAEEHHPQQSKGVEHQPQQSKGQCNVVSRGGRGIPECPLVVLPLGGPCQAHHMNMSYVSLIIHTCSVLHQISTPFKFRFLCVSLSSFCCYCICVLMCALQPCLLLKCFASILCFGSCFHCFGYLAALFFSKICTYVCLYKIPFGLQWMQQICLGAYGPKVSKSMRTRVSLTRQRPFWTNLWLGSISCASSGNLFGDLSPTFPVPLQTSLHLLAQLRTMLCFLALLWTFPCPSAYTTDVYQLCTDILMYN